MAEVRLMADRLKSLARIQAVQAQMVRLTEWRLAAAERTCRALSEDQMRLRAYVSGEGQTSEGLASEGPAGESALGAPLAKAALKSIHGVDRKLVQAERDRDAEHHKFGVLKRRERVAASMTEQAQALARRAGEDRDLRLTMDAWIASRDAAP